MFRTSQRTQRPKLQSSMQTQRKLRLPSPVSPSDFAQNVKVPDGMSYADGKIKFGSALPGSYTVTVSDAKGKYADVTAKLHRFHEQGRCEV